MPEFDDNRQVITAAPKHTGMKIMSIINALYQSGFVDQTQQDYMARLTSVGMETGNFTALFWYAYFQNQKAPVDNVFFREMMEALKT